MLIVFITICISLWIVSEALSKYKSKNGTLPKSIVIYRDGVGEGQISDVYKIEVKLLKVGIFYALV